MEYLKPMRQPPCAKCARLWAKYVYIREELIKKLLAAELSGDCLGLTDLEDSRVLVREEFRAHVLTHCEKKAQAAG